MSVACKVWLVSLIVMAVGAIAPMSLFGAPGPTSAVCDAHQCTVNVPEKQSDAQALCPSTSVQISWAKGDQWRLVTCPCNCSEQNNKNWFVGPNGQIIGMEAGRYFGKELFASTLSPIIPDVMGSRHRLCEPADRKDVDASTLIMLDKVPSKGGSDPYCYHTMYVTTSAADVTITEDGKILAKNDTDYFVTVDNETKKHLIALLAAVTQPETPSPGLGSLTAAIQKTVTAERAYLYASPSISGVTKAYLIKGDTIVLDAGQAPSPFLKFTYTTKSGKVIRKLIRCEDIDFCAPGS